MLSRLVAELSGGEEIGWQANARLFDALHDFGADAGGFEVTEGSSVVVNSVLSEQEYVLHDDRVLLHIEDLGDMCHFSRSALKTVDLNDDIHG